MDITIEQLKSEDIAQVSRIEEESFSMPWSQDDFARLVDESGTLYLVAHTEGRVAACCGVTNVSGDGYINNVVVSRDYRGMGIAQLLLRELMGKGKDMGIVDFTLEVRVSNAIAIHVYKKLGFVSEGIRPGFYEKPDEDAMIMWKRQDDSSGSV